MAGVQTVDSLSQSVQLVEAKENPAAEVNVTHVDGMK